MSRELGVPAVVGTVDATELLEDGREVTVSCAEGEEEYVYDGLLEFEAEEIDLTHLEETEPRIMINIAMIPFCRSPEEADRVLEVMAEEGLERERNGLQIYVMAEISANITLTEAFAERFDGFSVGSNDLTQLVLGIDRDSEKLAYLFDERNEAVTQTIAELIERAHAVGTPVGICGQAPSDYPEFAAFLVEHGIDSISLNPDSVPAVIRSVAEAESRRAESVQAAQ